MDSDGQDGLDSRTEFRRPGNDASNRKYRRRSPGGGSSSSSGGSPSQKRSLSPFPCNKDNLKISDDKIKKIDIRSHSGRSSESYKYSDRKSPRSYNRRNDYGRRERHDEDYDRVYPKSSSRSWRDTRDDLDNLKGDKEHQREYSRSKYDSRHNRDSFDRLGSGSRHANLEERDMDRDRDSDRYRQREERSERYGNTDHKKRNRDHRSEISPAHALDESSRGQRNTCLEKGKFGQNLKEDSKELYAEKYGNEEKRCKDQTEHKEHESKLSREHSNDVSGAGQEPITKKSKFSPMDNSGLGKEAHGTSEQAFVTDADIDAAKLTAMKAAEMVNRNLVGTGYLSADQKKKLLWGSKKSNDTTEESAKRWDSTMFVDRERQEKFNKLMGVKGEAKIDLKSDNPELEKQREQLQIELEKQYTAGLRRKDGRTVGLGL